MRVYQGLTLILIALVGSGSSLTCYSNENGTESECSVSGPDLHHAIISKDSEKIRGICYTFETLEGSGDNKRSQIYLGCSSEDKQTTCDNLKEKYLLGKNLRKVLTSCLSCNQDLCNIDPSESVTWIKESQLSNNREERQWLGKSKPRPTQRPLPPPTTTTPAITTPNPLNELQTTEVENREELISSPTPDQNNKNEEILGRAAPWGNTNINNNQNKNQQLNNKLTTKYPSNRNEEYTTPRDDSQEEEEGNFNQGGRINPGNNFGGQQPGYNGQQRPGGNNNNNFGQQRPSGNNNNFGQQRPGGNNNNNNNFGQQPGNNFGQTQRPGGNNFGQTNEGNGQQPNGFDREDKFKPSTGGSGQVGQKPDGSWGTGVQYATKHPTLTEQRPTSYPTHHGGVKQPLQGHHRPSYNSKEPEGVPRESSASNLNNVAIFVVSIIFMILY